MQAELAADTSFPTPTLDELLQITDSMVSELAIDGKRFRTKENFLKKLKQIYHESQVNKKSIRKAFTKAIIDVIVRVLQLIQEEKVEEAMALYNERPEAFGSEPPPFHSLSAHGRFTLDHEAICGLSYKGKAFLPNNLLWLCSAWFVLKARDLGIKIRDLSDLKKRLNDNFYYRMEDLDAVLDMGEDSDDNSDTNEDGGGGTEASVSNIGKSFICVAILCA